jgi:hypothetical protein
VLSPGETASADVDFDDNAPPHPVAAYLEITHPNDTHYLTMPIPCGRGQVNQGDLYVTRPTPY